MELVAIVSNGDDVWELSVTGPMKNNTYVNIALMWEPPDMDVLKGGLQVPSL
jgi:hypothetical protein